MAEETLVHRSSSDVSNTSKETANNRGYFVSTQNKNCSSKSSNIQSDCMASTNRSFLNKGFSSKARKCSLMESDNTKRLFCKIQKLSSWCSEREINPHSASKAQCADSLLCLFQAGLKYRTIAGYRSMISVILAPVEGIEAGQHQGYTELYQENRSVHEWRE